MPYNKISTWDWIIIPKLHFALCSMGKWWHKPYPGVPSKTLPFSYLPTFESQKTEHAILRGSKATKPEGGKLPRGEGGVPPPRVGSFCIFGLQIVQSGAYLERKFRLNIYCIAWKATNLKIPKTERSVFVGFKNFKNGTVLLKTERLASLHFVWLLFYFSGLYLGLKSAKYLKKNAQ